MRKKKLQLSRETIQNLHHTTGGAVSRAFTNCNQSCGYTCGCDNTNTCVTVSAHGESCLCPTIRD
jgi:hypothetical protein